MWFSRHEIFQIERLEISHIHEIGGFQRIIRQCGHESRRWREIINNLDLGIILEQRFQLGRAVTEEPQTGR